MTSLSVVIPTFNRQETLASTMASCLELSTDLPVDFVIVDDGSTDNTAIYLEKLAASHANVSCVSIENGGPGNARNVGAQRATGDIILFMGDDTRPTSREFFLTHIRMHERFPERTLGVLGKIVWPQDRGYHVTYVMSLIQGEGQQQFGFAYMRPYARYDWRFFYTANVSLKRSCVDDWMESGFSRDFRCAAFEDGEFAYRLSKKLGSFDVLYAPTALVEHDHSYSAESFLNRQFAAGMMANVLIEKHPETAPFIGLADLIQAMKRPVEEVDSLNEVDYLAAVEGIFAWARLLDRNDQLGSLAWHTPFVNAAFELAYLKGVIWTFSDLDANRAAGYRYALDQLDNRMARTLEHENLASVVPSGSLRKSAITYSPMPTASFVDGAKRRLRTRLAQYETARRVYRWLKA